MGLLSNGVERSEIKPGDHIYTWRVIYTYSHHGIYVGGSKVVHFTREEENGPSSIGTSVNSSASSIGTSLNSTSSSSKLPSNFNSFNSFGSSSKFPSNFNSFNSFGSSSKLPSNNSFNSFGSSLPGTCPTFPDCGFKQPSSGVILSCLDCFLGNGNLYLFEYGVTPSVFIAKVRGGTCTTAVSDPPDTVIHRAMYLLQKGFGNYDIFLNNCEDFALYCKTGLLTLDKSGVGGSGQASSIIGAPLAAIFFTPLKFLMPGPVGVAVTAGMYCMSRYATDIGIRSDVIKVAVEDMQVNPGWGRRPGKEAAMEEEKKEAPKKQVPRNGLGLGLGLGLGVGTSIVKQKKSS